MQCFNIIYRGIGLEARQLVYGRFVKLVVDTLGEWIGSAAYVHWYHMLVVAVALGLGVLLVYLIVQPIFRRKREIELHLPEFKVPDVNGVKYERIAVALEASESDRILVEKAMSMAVDHSADLLLLHVADGMAPRVWSHEAEDHEVLADEAYLDRLAIDINARGIRTKPVLGFGSPPEEIVRLVNEEKADMLIIGTHGHRMIKDIFLGATATRVRHQVSIPVFMVRVE